MCARYTHTLTWRQIVELYRLTLDHPPRSNLQPRYNIAPTQTAMVIRETDTQREPAFLRWGLVPSWSDGPDPKYSNINARAEIVEKAAPFRAAYKRRRCLVPASGFYEWRKEKGGKQPYYIYPAEGEAFTFAGLWERWEGQGQTIESFTIITTDANEKIRALHDRMPAILMPDEFQPWIQEGDKAVLEPCHPELVKMHRVSKRVNNPGNDDVRLIEVEL